MEIIGRDLELGFGVEKVRGVAQTTAEKWAKSITANIIEKAEHVIDESSQGVLEDSEQKRVVKKWIEGGLEGNVHADAIGYLLYNIYGGVASSVVSGSVYSHVFNIDQSIEHPSLTLFAKDGGVQQLAYANCMLGSLEVKASVDGMVGVTGNFMGASASSNSDVPIYDTEYDFVGCDFSVKVADTEAGLSGAVATKIKDLSITFDTGLIVDNVLGSCTPDDIYNAKMSIEGSFTRNFDETTFKDLFLAETAKYMEVTIEGSKDIGGGEHAGMTFLFNKIQVIEWDRSGANDELVSETVGFKAFYNETDGKASQITLQNLTEEYSTPISD